MRGRKPKPSNLRRAEGNPGKRGFNAAEPEVPPGCPECPPHLGDAARAEWFRLATTLHKIGILTTIDRAAFAAYCQAWGRWVEAEDKIAQLAPMVRTPSGYVQQNPWIGVANKQIDLMTRLAAELGLTPASRTRVTALRALPADPAQAIEIVIVRPEDKASGGRDAPRAAGLPGFARKPVIEIDEQDMSL